MEERTITIPKDLAEKLEKRAKESDFDSLSDYINYVLRQILSKIESKGFSKEDEEKVKQKLKDLGYLD